MCGFSGVVVANRQHTLAKEWRGRFAETAQRIAHRGSDDSRLVSFYDVSLNHFRLAFQDLESGRQPMLTSDGKYAITFNGEIYNHLILRNELEKKCGQIAWRTNSDTETILTGWLKEGITFFDQLEGEFAFVITRTDGSEWVAARDHFGVKPLFFALADTNTRIFSEARECYTLTADVVAFASEIKALPLKKRWNRDGALRQFVGLFEPICTPFEEIIQCPPGGRIIACREQSLQSQQSFRIEIKTKNQALRSEKNTPFWSSQDVEHSLSAFRDTFSSSVSERLLSDVELGVYLSGGIDSKAVAYELSKSIKEKRTHWQKNALKSFTVGFESAAYDESREALEFSRYLGFKPHVLTLSNTALNYSYPQAVYISENIQPFTNGAAKWWLSLFARQHVPGVLTGDGADELLCGYPSFRYCAWWAFAQRNRKSNLPLGKRWRDSVYTKKFISQTTDPWLSGSSAEGRGVDFEKSLSVWGIPHPLFEQIEAITIAILGEPEASTWLASQGSSIRSWFLLGFEKKLNTEPLFAVNPENALRLWQNYFCHTHLPVQILNWVGDRMEMANTLEGRTPFLSGGMRKFVAQLPDIALVQGLTDKAILRKAYASQLPHHFTTTPKKQFNAPFLQFESLYREFDTAEILKRMGLNDHGEQRVLKLLKQSQNAHRGLLTAQENYMQVHHMAALQTLICSAIVQRTIVDEHIPQRDASFEQLILTKKGQNS